MDSNIAGALIAALVGALIAYINYRISLSILRHKPELLSIMSVIRQAINIAYFAGVYFLSPLLPWDMVPLLLGAAAGITVPMFVFTALLVKKQTAAKIKHGAETDEAAAHDNSGNEVTAHENSDN